MEQNMNREMPERAVGLGLVWFFIWLGKPNVQSCSSVARHVFWIEFDSKMQSYSESFSRYLEMDEQPLRLSSHKWAFVSSGAPISDPNQTRLMCSSCGKRWET